MRKTFLRILAFLAAALLSIPDLVMAAGGKAEALIVVADNRVVNWSVTKWWLDLYNTDPLMFGVWCIIITAVLGVTLGFITDQIMKYSGIDLTSRKIVEH